MKKIRFFLLFSAMLFVLAQCTKTGPTGATGIGDKWIGEYKLSQ